MIQDIKYRVCYYMVLALLFLAALNIYLSIVYYIQLRNNPGVQGPIGPKGPKGMTGSSGKCNFSDSCNITGAKEKIIKEASAMYDIVDDCFKNPNLANCGSQDKLDQVGPINVQISMLESIANTTTMAENDFLDKIRVCLTDSNSCMDATDF